ncbi:MAG TPA: FkbM family methyltransferase [Gaiellaceae bacterium]
MATVAAQATGMGTAPTAMRLPNGWTVLQLNPAETSLQYRDIVATRAYLQHGLAVRAGDTVVDVGANIGISSLFFHAEAPGVRIYAFEPAPLPFAALRANVMLHGVDAKVFRCGLSNRARSVPLTYYPHVTAMSSVYAEPEHDAGVTRRFLLNSGFDESDVADMTHGLHVTETVECELRTLSSVIEGEGIERIDLLKLNVEKAEPDVLAGIEDEHWPLVRQVTMQVHDAQDGVAAVRAELGDRGFEVWVGQDPLLRGTDIFDLYATRRRGAAA